MPNRSIPRNLSLRTLLLSLFVLEVLLAAGATAWLSHRNSTQAIHALADQLSTEVMTRVTEHLDAYFESAQAVNRLNVRLALDGQLALGDINRLAHYFWEQGHIFPGLGTIAFADKDGNFVGANQPEDYIVIAVNETAQRSIRRYAPNEEGFPSARVLQERSDYDARKREWFQTALLAAGPTWTAISPSNTGARLDLSATAPLYDQSGTFQGIFLTDVSLANLSSFLQRLNIGKTGQAFIIEPDGKLVASSFRELPFLVAESADGKVERLAARDSKSPLIAAAAALLARESDGIKDAPGKRRLLAPLNGNNHFIQIEPYRKHNLDFLTLVVIPEEDFMAETATGTRNTLWLIGAAVLMALGFGTWMTKRLLEPIRHLSMAAAKLGQGDWQGQVPVARQDEVGVLAETFNTMTARLHHSFALLREENEARKNTEASILETLNLAEDEAEKTKAIIAAIGDAISIQDTEYRVLYQNAVHQEIVGNHVGEYCYQAYEGREDICEGCPVALSFQDGKVHRAERTNPRLEGERYFEITTSPVRDSTGKTIAGIEVVRDTTERHRMEKELAEEKERLAVTLRSIGDGVIAYNLEGRVVLLNKQAEQLTGWAQEEAIGRPLHEVFRVRHRETSESLDKMFLDLLVTGKTLHLPGNMILSARDDGERIIADSGAPIRDRESRTIGIVVVFRDVTLELKTEEELLKVRKLEAVGILAGGIAHDFNNILVAILGNINLAMQMTDKDSRAYPLLDDAARASLRAKDLTSQLLTFSKGGNPVKELSSIGEVIRDSASFILHGGNAACTFDIPENLWLADLDRGQISQVIQNIILNARHAMPEGGTIQITCRNVEEPEHENIALDRDLRFIKIMIRDTGIGIPEKVITKIFDPYFTTKSEGSGLGLAISHSIITKHQGHITVWSRPGRGTTFTIYLPASPGKTLPADHLPETVTPAADTGLHILLMDDDDMVRQVAGNMLEFMGHQVVHAAEGHEAVTLFRQSVTDGRPFDLVIMDLTIPGGMGGQEAVGELLRISPLARVIVSSGYSNDPILADFRKYGFRAAVVKPFQLNELNTAINRAMQ